MHPETQYQASFSDIELFSACFLISSTLFSLE